MLLPKEALRLLAPYEKFERSQNGSLEEKKKNLKTGLGNCHITIDHATNQLTVLKDPMLLDDVLQMRAAAIAAIPLAEAALAATSDEDFNHWRSEFDWHYDTLIRSVRSFLWDGGGRTRHLFSLVEEIM